MGERIRRLRLERGLSQRELAGPGVSGSYLSRVEGGERNPSAKALRVVAARLGVSAEYLEYGVDTVEIEVRLSDAELELRLGEAAAADKLEAIEALLEDRPDSALLERARVGLALARSAEGRHVEAVAILERVLEDRRPQVAERPDLYAALGRSYAAIGEPARAAALFRRCLDEIESNKVLDKPLSVRFATYLSYALTDIGDLAGAQQAVARGLAHAEGISDRYAKIRLYWSLARLYGVQGPPELTLAYYRRAISLLEQTEDRFYLARAHEACGSALLDQGDPHAARAHLEAAEQIYEEEGQRPQIGSVRTELSRFHLQTGELESARRLALEALDLLDEGAGDPDDVGDAWRTLGEVFAEIGEHELATQAFETAIETLRKGAPVKYLGDAYRSYADFLHSVGRESEAFSLLRQAVSLTTSPGPEHQQSER